MTFDPNSRKAYNYLLQKNFSAFYRQYFTSIHKNTSFSDNWHIDAISEFLTGMRMGQFKRGNINISPRWGKTLQCSVAFPMWWLGDEPWLKVICASYSASLSHKIHGKCRTLANSSWYRSAFPEFSIRSAVDVEVDQAVVKNTQREFITTAGGCRIATSTGGSITGDGGDLIIGDDLMNPEEAASPVQRESCIDWTKETLFSRFDDKKKGMLLNVQQRLHDEDFTGIFVDKNWESLIVPVRFEEKKFYYVNKKQIVCKEGDWLDESRYGQAEMDEDLKNMGSKNFSMQYLQKTVPDDGEIFKKSYLKYYTYAPKLDYRAIYADTAQEEDRNADWSVFMCWGFRNVNGRKYAYLIDILRKKMTSPKLLVAAKEFWHKHSMDLSIPLLHGCDWIPPAYSLDDNGELIKFAIEKKSSGSGLIQDLEDATNIPVTHLLPEKDKVLRANDTVPRWESGQVLLPKDAPWLPEFEKELLIFSSKKGNNKKDQVDTATYAIKDLLFDPVDTKDRPMDYSGLINESKIYGRQ